MAVRVYLLDDHEIVRRGLAELLSTSGRCEVVGESGSAAEAIRRIPAARPDVAILDGRLPDGTGMEVCRAVRSVDESIRCLILTSYDDDEALLAAILAGASGYVLKQVRGADLVETIERVAAGESLLKGEDADRIRARLTGEDVMLRPELAALTDQEKRVLDLITQGFTNRQIAGRLHLAEKTVKNYITSLLSKLGLESRTQAAVLMERLRHPHD
ncbi:response regulator transcription factor [Dermacoccus abyssi]|uniref:response regulator n=1 Tax=Dermacoccus abyssi TaxID=322596 RepID=UPI0021A81C59|nr:response regulator transcription factor [Dermacoccus abyssi]MCT1985538.1 response regulator transcription factor [Dermacoccus abyssi]